MNNDPLRDFEPKTPEVYYHEQILALLEEFPSAEVSERAIELSITLLEEVKAKYGDENSENYKPYHNDEHALKVIRRAWRLWEIIRTELPGRFDEKGFELLLIAGAGHDIVWNSDTPDGEDEQESAEVVAKHMRDAGYEEEDILRVTSAILATTVERAEDGTIIQSKIREGNKDLLKFVLATADVDGIAMEGAPTMLGDAFNLFLESIINKPGNTSSRLKTLYGFLKYQTKYLQDREKARPGDLRHYFSKEEIAIINEVYRAQFKNTIIEAQRAAEKLRTNIIAERAIRTTFGGAIWFFNITSDNLDKVKEEIKRVLFK